MWIIIQTTALIIIIIIIACYPDMIVFEPATQRGPLQILVLPLSLYSTKCTF